MKTVAAFLALAFLLAPTTTLAQVREEKSQSPRRLHAFERIEKSMKELEASSPDARARQLIDEIRAKAEALRQHLTGVTPPKQILFEIRLIDLEAKGTRAAWTRAFGSVPEPERTRVLPEDITGKLKGLPGLISAPSILVNENSPAQLSVGEETAIAYLKRQGDGHYSTESTKVKDGLDLGVRGRIEKNGDIVLGDLTVSVSRMVGKTEFAPEAPTVGLPIMSTRSWQMKMRLSAGRHHAFMPVTDGEGSIIIILMAKPLDEMEAPVRAR